MHSGVQKVETSGNQVEQRHRIRAATRELLLLQYENDCGSSGDGRKRTGNAFTAGATIAARSFRTALAEQKESAARAEEADQMAAEHNVSLRMNLEDCDEPRDFERVLADKERARRVSGEAGGTDVARGAVSRYSGACGASSPGARHSTWLVGGEAA